MAKISARLQSLLQKNDSYDPFNLEFKPNKIETLEDWDAGELGFVNQISDFNAAFLIALRNIMKALRHHGFKKPELINALFAKGNKHFAFVADKMHNKMAGDDQPVDHDRLRYLEIEDYRGKMQSSVQAVEYLSELYGLLLTYQEKFDILTQKHVPEADKGIHDIDIVIQYLIQMVNIIFNLRIAYHLLVYAAVDADLTDNKHLKLSAEDDGVNLLSSINESRSGSHFNEIFFPLYQAIKSFPAKGPKIENLSVYNGFISINVTSGNIDRINQAAQIAKSMAFYEYLADLKLPFFQDISIQDLLTLTGYISELCDQNFKPPITLDSEFDDIPYKINRQRLVSYLVKMSELPESVVDTFLNSVTNPSGGEIDFFRYPLYAFEEDIYLLFTALSAPHGHPLVERWLQISGINEEQQKKIFRDYAIKDLEASSKEKLPHGIAWHVCKKPPGLEQNEFCLETRDQLLIISCQVFRFTGNKKEEVSLLVKYREVFSDFEKRLIALQPYAQTSNKKIVPVCVSADVHYSGIILENIPIVDLVLLKNYLVVGQFQRVKMINDPKKPKIRNLYDYPYYSNQNEFETNLINFLWKPYPIYNQLKKMAFKQAPLLPPEMEFQISYYVPDMISEEEEEEDDMESLDHLLKAQLFVNDQDPEYNQLIHNIIRKTFAVLADKRRNNLEQIPAFVNKISGSNRISATHLSIYLRRGVESMRHMTKTKIEPFVATNYGAKEFLDLYNRVLESVAGQGIQFSEFKMNIPLTEHERQQLISGLANQLSNVGQRKYLIEEQEQILLNLAVMGSLVKKPAELSLLFLAYGNFVESLNFNQDYQKARDTAYELWLFCQKIDHPIQGLNILFKCYIKQRNFLYAGAYGGILLSALDSLSEIDDDLFLEVLFNLFRYFRDFGYHEFAKTVWKIAQKEKLSPYNDQKFTLSYFNMRLSGGLKQDSTLIKATSKYVTKNLKSILKFGKHGAIPWFAFYSSIKKQGELYKINLPPHIDQTRLVFEKTIDDAQIVDNLNMQINGATKNFKVKFIEMLVKVYSNLYYTDYKFNVINLRPIADNAFREGLIQQDSDLIILTSLVYNDQQLNFIDHDAATGTVRFDLANSRLEPKVLMTYSEYMLKHIILTKGQVLFWLVEFNNQAYSVVITSNKQIKVNFLEQWNPKFMNHWVRNELPRFYFNSIKSKYYDLGEQEQATSKLVKSLSKFDLKIEVEFEEILILKSVNMAGYPDNLMINHGKLLSRSTPICNILNLEHFINHQDRILINFTKINAWIPKIGKDGTISFGHDDLSPLLTKFEVNIIDEAVLIDMPAGNINIFMAHGNTGLDGFKSFQSEEDKYQFNFHMFGTGDIAILFICNSGNLRDDFQSQDIKSVGQELIKQGYRAVIAPFWKYDVTMSRIWLTEFFKVFQEGFSINQSVHLSNRKVAEYDAETGRFFDEPGGWAAMHLYGNPNLYFGIDEQA